MDGVSPTFDPTEGGWEGAAKQIETPSQLVGFIDAALRSLRKLPIADDSFPRGFQYIWNDEASVQRSFEFDASDASTAVAEYNKAVRIVVRWLEDHGFTVPGGMPPAANDLDTVERQLSRLLDHTAAVVGHPQPPDETGHRHSSDFRSLQWYGTDYNFTANQAPVVKLLYENWTNGTPDVGDETLLMAVDPESPPARLSVLFRGHKAWGIMIVAGSTKGTHRLQQPAENP